VKLLRNNNNKKQVKTTSKTSRFDKVTLIDAAENFENHSHKMLVKLAIRLITGFLHFRKRKGEILAGSTTFFGILSFGPVLLLMISMVGWSGMSDVQAKDYVLDAIEHNFPTVASSVLKSIEDIITARLKTGFADDFLNLFFLLYSSMGIISSIMFGMHSIAQQEIRGGFLVEDLRSMLVGIFGSLFIFSLLFYGYYGPILAKKMVGPGSLEELARYMLTSNTVPIALSLTFFTFFYQFASTNIVRLKDSFLGAITFVACFSLGKSFYWLYLQLSQETLTQSYGSFYTMFVAVFWVYYLMCSFFYGASVAFCYSQEEVERQKRENAKLLDQANGVTGRRTGS
jgi:membrane protein